MHCTVTIKNYLTLLKYEVSRKYLGGIFRLKYNWSFDFLFKAFTDSDFDRLFTRKLDVEPSSIFEKHAPKVISLYFRRMLFPLISNGFKERGKNTFGYCTAIDRPLLAMIPHVVAIPGHRFLSNDINWFGDLTSRFLRRLKNYARRHQGKILRDYLSHPNTDIRNFLFLLFKIFYSSYIYLRNYEMLSSKETKRRKFFFRFFIQQWIHFSIFSSRDRKYYYL